MILFELNRFEFEISLKGRISKNAIADYQQVTETIHVILCHLKI